jgi:Na+-transporting methylmalonyl-CoA/oxaloacetate decarboxylase gamma subunit
MNVKLLVFVAAIASVLFLSPLVAATFAPHTGDSFSYTEVTNLGNGVGDYAGYTEQGTYNGTETVTGVNSDGTVSVHYSYVYSWSNSTGTTETGQPQGDFTFSPTSFLYVNGTDDQTGYVSPSVWFCMDPSTPQGGTFTMLNTQMTIISKGYNYYLPSQDKTVLVIYAEGASTYQRNDVYGQFTASYTWGAYFDPTTGYIVGYSYHEDDSNPSGEGFTYTENLYVTSTSYPLTTASGSPNVPTFSPFPTSVVSTPNPAQFALLAAGVVIVIIVLIIIVALVVAISRRGRRTLPRHSYQQSPPPPSPPPESINLKPNQQPEVQQIVVKEVVKVKCRYCGALIDSTAETCPICGAPRT